MKKIILSLAVLAVTGLGGYGLTKVAIDNSKMMAAELGDPFGWATPQPLTAPLSGPSINSKPTCPDCSEKEEALKYAQRLLLDIIDFPPTNPGSPTINALQAIKAQANNVKEAQKALEQCNELKKAYCDGYDQGKDDARKKTSTPPRR